MMVRKSALVLLTLLSAATLLRVRADDKDSVTQLAPTDGGEDTTPAPMPSDPEAEEVKEEAEEAKEEAEEVEDEAEEVKEEAEEAEEEAETDAQDAEKDDAAVTTTDATTVPTTTTTTGKQTGGDGDGGVFTNFNSLQTNGEGFALHNMTLLYESPTIPPSTFLVLLWLGDLHIIPSTKSYSGRTLQYFLDDRLRLAGRKDDVGAQAIIHDNAKAKLFAATYLPPPIDVFEGVLEHTADDYTIRFWDDGTSVSNTLIWEGHDEGNPHDNAVTSAFTGTGTITWITATEAASILNVSAIDELTPSRFHDAYETIWSKNNAADDDDASSTSSDSSNSKANIAAASNCWLTIVVLFAEAAIFFY